ncbi:hypothetical protein BDV28DRAFT_149274 [Aspergillus coremiiformis]|uniref:DUF7702 domain-containing protein n=1 Tax=Aspergillus coremiiformis TaxID=138285 RepID=A0A5N6Z3D1_9EURO|nr:hypothetical protein BDV28DRAFT_149274 [Aspergillus coremiiformis]
MSFPTFSLEKRHIAIAEIVIFSLIQFIQFPTRFLQEWKYWHHKKRKYVGFCFLYAWFGFIGLVAQIRIVGSGMVLSATTDENILIAEIILQSIGVSPLLIEASFLMLRSGQTGRTGPENSRYPKHILVTLQVFRFLVLFSIVLIVVGGSVENHACRVVGSVALVLTFAFGYGLFFFVAVAYRTILPRAGHRCVLIVLTALPFFVVRIVYMLLAQFGPSKFSSATGDGSVMVGMGLLMEILIIIILFSARAVAEPVGGEVSVDAGEARV